MNLKLILVMVVYVFVALIMCAFILANEDAESLGNPSPMSVVRSTQKGSIIEYIIWSFASLFLVSCIILNRLRNAQSLSKVLDQTLSITSNSKSKEESNLKLIQENVKEEPMSSARDYTESEDIPNTEEFILDDEELDDLDKVLRVNE